MLSLGFLAVVQIGTAVLLLVPGAPPLFGILVPPRDFVVYLYFCASLYAALGLLYAIGAFRQEYRKAAQTIACVDVALEILSCWLGLPVMGTPYWLIALFSVALLVPGIVCFIRLMEGRRSSWLSSR